MIYMKCEIVTSSFLPENKSILIYDTIASFSSLFYSNVKSYRAALFAYRVNLLNSIPALLNNFIPMTLLGRASLEKVIAEVQAIQNKALDRLTFAIPVH